MAVPAGGQSIVRLRLRAAKRTGAATISLAAALGRETYEESVEFPVRPAAPLTSFMGAGSVKAGQETTIRFPTHFFPGTGRYELLFAGEPTVDLAGGLQYLLRYPYGCVEQTTSQCLPLLYLRDLAASVDPDLAAPGQVEHFVASGIARVLSMQTPSGGFAYWPGYRNENPWASCYAAQFLIEARKAGYEVPDAPYKAMLAYLRRQLEAGPTAVLRRTTGRTAADRAARRAAERRAYLCYVLALAGQPAESWMARLREEEADLPAIARAHLAAALAASGQLDRAHGLLAVAMPRFGKTPQTGGNLNSPSRDVALFLGVLLDTRPDSPHIPALVSRLNGLRVRGRWGTTQENAMALMALGKYARLRAKQPNDYTAAINVAGRDPITLTEKDRRRIAGDLARKKITVTVNGTGALNYFWMAEGVPTSGEVKEEDRGLAIRRRLLDRTGSPLPFREKDRARVGASQANVSLPPQPGPYPVGLPRGGEGNSLGPPPPAGGRGTVSLRQGDLVVVELRIKAPRPVENVVVVDLLPAGLEIENPRLATTEGQRALRSTLEPDRLDIRDDRLILFTGLRSGWSTYHYVARAVTGGRFRLPPAQAACMYDPALASIHGSGRIEVRP